MKKKLKTLLTPDVNDPRGPLTAPRQPRARKKPTPRDNPSGVKPLPPRKSWYA